MNTDRPGTTALSARNRVGIPGLFVIPRVFNDRPARSRKLRRVPGREDRRREVKEAATRALERFWDPIRERRAQRWRPDTGWAVEGCSSQRNSADPTRGQAHRSRTCGRTLGLTEGGAGSAARTVRRSGVRDRG